MKGYKPVELDNIAKTIISEKKSIYLCCKDSRSSNRCRISWYKIMKNNSHRLNCMYHALFNFEHLPNIHLAQSCCSYFIPKLQHLANPTEFHYPFHLFQFLRPPAKHLRAWTSRRRPRTTLKPYPPTRLHPVCQVTRTQYGTLFASSSNHALQEAISQQHQFRNRGRPAAITTTLSASIRRRWSSSSNPDRKIGSMSPFSRKSITTLSGEGLPLRILLGCPPKDTPIKQKRLFPMGRHRMNPPNLLPVTAATACSEFKFAWWMRTKKTNHAIDEKMKGTKFILVDSRRIRRLTVLFMV